MNRLIVEGYRKDRADRAARRAARQRPRTGARFMRTPPEALRDAVLEHLVQARGHGLRAPALRDDRRRRTRVRPGLARAFLEAFHRLRWSGAPELEWVVLGGEHVEGAVANVVVDGELHSYTRIPLVSPNVGGVQMFVNHPQVTALPAPRDRRVPLRGRARRSIPGAAETRSRSSARRRRRRRSAASRTACRCSRSASIATVTPASSAAA